MGTSRSGWIFSVDLPRRWGIVCLSHLSCAEVGQRVLSIQLGQHQFASGEKAVGELVLKPARVDVSYNPVVIPGDGLRTDNIHLLACALRPALPWCWTIKLCST